MDVFEIIEEKVDAHKIADSLYEQNQFAEAATKYAIAASAYGEQENKNQVAFCFMRCAECHEKNNNPQQAATFYKTAGINYQQLKDIENAKINFLAAKRCFEKSDNKNGVLEIEQLLSELSGDFEEQIEIEEQSEYVPLLGNGPVIRPKWRLFFRDIVQNPLAEKLIIPHTVQLQSLSCTKKKTGKFSQKNTTVNDSDMEEVTSFSENENNHGENIPLMPRPKIPYLEYYLVLNTIPIKNVKNLYEIAARTDFIRGGKTFFGELWPAIFTGLLAHDLIEYFIFPESRFGITLQDIFLGTATNQATWTADLSNNVVGLSGFWIAPGLLLITPLAMAMYNWWRYRGCDNQTVSTDVFSLQDRVTGLTDSLKERSAGFFIDLCQGFFSYAFRRDLHQAAFLILWDARLSKEQAIGLLAEIVNLAQNHSNLTRWAAMEKLRQIADSFHPSNLKALPLPKHYQELYQTAHKTLKKLSQLKTLKKSPLTYLYANWLRWTIAKRPALLFDLLFPLWTAYLLATQIRFWQLIARKIKDIVDFIIAQKACNKWDGQWLYREEFGEFVCTVCGEWPFVSAQMMNSSQGCLDALLQSVQNATEVLQHIPQVLKHPDFEAVNFYLQNSQNWSDEAWGELLGNLSFAKKELQLLNISQPLPTTNFLTPPYAGALLKFLEIVNVKTLDFTNEQMGASIFKQLLPGFIKSRTRELLLLGNEIGDEGFIALSEVFNQTAVTKLVADQNGLTDKSVITFFKALPSNNKTISNLSGEKCIYVDESGVHVEQLQENTRERKQNRNHTFIELHVERNDLTAEGLETIAVLSPERTVEILYMGGNDFSRANMTLVGHQIAQSSIKVLHLDDTELEDNQVSDLGNTLLTKDSAIKELDIRNNNFIDGGTISLINNARNSNLQRLFLGGNLITDQGLGGIATYLSQTAITDLGLNNCDFGTAGLKLLLQNLKKSQGGKLLNLDISGNLIGDDVAELLAQNIGLSLEGINLSAMQMTDNGGKYLVLAMQVSDFKCLQVNSNQLTDTSFIPLASNLPKTGLVMIAFNENQLGLPSVQKLATVLANTTLQELYLKDNQIPDQGGVAIAEQLLTVTPQSKTIDGTISRDEAHALRKAKPNTQLKKIDFSGNQLGKKSKRAFNNVLPNQSITYINHNNSAFFQPNNQSSLNSSNNNDNTGTGVALGIAMVPVVFLTIFAIYLIYRLGRDTVNYFYPNPNSNHDPEDPSCSNQKSPN